MNPSQYRRHLYVILVAILLLCCALIYSCQRYEQFATAIDEPKLLNGTFTDNADSTIRYYMSGRQIPGNLNTIPGNRYIGVTYDIQIHWTVNGLNYTVAAIWNPYKLGNTWTGKVSTKSVGTPNFTPPYTVTVTISSTTLTMQFPSNATGVGQLTKVATKVSDSVSTADAAPSVIPYLHETWQYPNRYRNTKIETVELGPAYMSCKKPVSAGTCAESDIECTMNPNYKMTESGRSVPNCQLTVANWDSTSNVVANGFMAALRQPVSNKKCTYPTATPVLIMNMRLKKFLTILPEGLPGRVVWASKSPTDKVKLPPPTNSSEYMNQNPMDHDLYSTFDASVPAPTYWTIVPVAGLASGSGCVVMLQSGPYSLRVDENGRTLDVTTYPDGVEQYFIWNQLTPGEVVLSPMIMPNMMISYGEQQSGYLSGSYVAECIPTNRGYVHSTCRVMPPRDG